MVDNQKPQRAVCSQQEMKIAHKLVEKIQTTGFYPSGKRKTKEEKERGISQPLIHQEKGQNLSFVYFDLFCILKVTISGLAKKVKRYRYNLRKKN